MDECSWQEARQRARDCARQVEPVVASLEDAVGAVLSSPLLANEDIPAFDAASVDGWAVSGKGPWKLRRPTKRDMLGGFDFHESTSTKSLREGQAAPVEAGDPLGKEVIAVVARTRGTVTDGLLVGNTLSASKPGAGIRARGSDSGQGSELMSPGERVTPAVASLAATAGHDELWVLPMPTVALVRIGDRVLDTGTSRKGHIRDTVGPALPGWIAHLNGRCQPSRWVTQGDGALIDELDDILADVVVATGPSSGPAVRRVLGGLGVTPLVDGVACQPGNSMMLAILPNGRPFIHCSAGPDDIVATLVTLLAPLIEGMTGQSEIAIRARFDDAVAGDRRRTTLIPVGYVGERSASVAPVRPAGPNGLLGLCRATAWAVIPVGGVHRHEPVPLLPMP